MTTTPVRSVDVLVAVITHERPAQLGRLLDAFGELDPLSSDGRVTFLVVDNAPALTGRAVVEGHAAAGLAITYRPLGRRNISVARNAVLDAAHGRASLVALIDDDETPDRGWLNELLRVQQLTGADLVTGPQVAVLPRDVAPWALPEHYAFTLAAAAGAEVDEGTTGNALLSLAAVQRLSLRFDEALGAAGGEDQLFFRTAVTRGARLVWAPGAVVREHVPASRVSIQYLLRREYRKGNTLGLLDRSRPGWPAGHPWRRAAASAWWWITGLLTAASACGTRDRTALIGAGMRLARAVGMAVGLTGQVFKLYATASDSRHPTIAIVTEEGPSFQSAGHSHVLRGLARHYQDLGWRVVLVVYTGRTGSLVRRDRDGEGTALRAPGTRRLLGVDVVLAPGVAARHLAWKGFRRAPHAFQRVVDAARRVVRGYRDVDHRLGAWMGSGETAWVNDVLEQERPDVLLLNGLFTSVDGLRIPTTVHTSLLMAHDVVTDRAAAFRARGMRVEPEPFRQEDERAALARVDAVLAIQPDDVLRLGDLAPETKVLLTMVSVDQPRAASPRVCRQPGRVLFVGSGSLHNVEGLAWLLEEVWPAVLARIPTAELHVVGTVCARTHGGRPGVHLRGEVSDLTDEYALASAVVVPLLTGSGLKVKIVEAICHGAAVVTTSVGAQGLRAVDPAPFLLADTPEAFADGLRLVLESDEYADGLRSAAAEAGPLFLPENVYAAVDAFVLSRGAAPSPPRS